MQLEDSFQFEKFDTPHGPVERIRIKGHRIAIEHVIGMFNQGMSPERIRHSYPTLTLEEVYATITYYLHNKQQVDVYIAQGEKIADAYYQEYLRQEPSPVVKRLRALKAQQEREEQEDKESSQHRQRIEAADLSGTREQLPSPKLGEPKDHWHLHAVCIHLPTDYEPYGYRVRDGSDCSCGCKWFLPLQIHPSDWGICANPNSPRCGLLTFEHQGCQFFTAELEYDDVE